MNKFTNVNINLKELEKDYGENVLKDYVRLIDNTKSKYIVNKYKTFMKTIMGIKEYKNGLVKSLGKYGTYLISISEYTNEDNSIDMNLFQEKLTISNSSLIRLIKTYKDNNILKKRGHIFYLSPLIVHYGKDIKLELGELFEDELKKVGILIK